jgi:predicted acylesterase/phospholipase RssA
LPALSTEAGVATSLQSAQEFRPVTWELAEGGEMVARDVALALSGGGYRASYFHLGVLRKLHELDLLNRVGVISSVSGGSIVAGSYAQSLLNNEEFAAFFRRTEKFLRENTLDWPALASEFILKSSAALEADLGELYTRSDGKLTRLSDLKQLEAPRFVFNATAVHSGRGWRFLSKGLAEEWELSQGHEAAFHVAVDRYRCDVTLAKAVTASAAFPLFSAVTVDGDDISTDPDAEPRKFSGLPDPLCLSDGGVIDNTGMTSILAGLSPPGWEADYYLIGSDAGALVNLDTDPPRGRWRKVSYLLRQFDIMGHHNNRMTVAFVLTVHRTRPGSKKGMAMLRFDEAVPELERKPEEAPKRVDQLIKIKTRLTSPDSEGDPGLARDLMEHGANLLWARVSEYTDLLPKDREMPGTRKRQPKDTN